ncbi:MAG TPA: DUF397 domain-containing protein [Actinoplanes sp.]|nr:DUF397 domain-containing protein [Actinoplanes sp.]
MLVTTMEWQRSSFCADNQCLEVAVAGDTVVVRDGKNTDLATLRFDRGTWNDFLDGIEAGDFIFADSPVAM